jgi:hypothetical protein
MKQVTEHNLGRLPAADQAPFITIALPEGAEILTVFAVGDDIFLRAMSDTAEPLDARTVRLFKTGQDMGQWAYEYLGSFQIGGETVHAFERF